jgi:hypothetical protein
MPPPSAADRTPMEPALPQLWAHVALPPDRDITPTRASRSAPAAVGFGRDEPGGRGRQTAASRGANARSHLPRTGASEAARSRRRRAPAAPSRRPRRLRGRRHHPSLGEGGARVVEVLLVGRQRIERRVRPTHSRLVEGGERAGRLVGRGRAAAALTRRCHTAQPRSSNSSFGSSAFSIGLCKRILGSRRTSRSFAESWIKLIARCPLTRRTSTALILAAPSRRTVPSSMKPCRSTRSRPSAASSGTACSKSNHENIRASKLLKGLLRVCCLV